MDKRIAFKIALCQIASDAGKGIKDVELIKRVGRSASHKAILGGYELKNQLIKELCYSIANTKKTGFRFWWEPANEDTFSIVYFECKLEGEILQVSFHNPGSVYKTWGQGSKDFKSHWDAKSSRETCCRILDAVTKS